jgi:hypothetical protein
LRSWLDYSLFPFKGGGRGGGGGDADENNVRRAFFFPPVDVLFHFLPFSSLLSSLALALSLLIVRSFSM